MTEAISAELRAHPDDAEPLASIAQAGDPWPPWLQDLLDRLLTRRMRGRVWRQIVAEVYAKVFN